MCTLLLVAKLFWAIIALSFKCLILYCLVVRTCNLVIMSDTNVTLSKASAKYTYETNEGKWD